MSDEPNDLTQKSKSNSVGPSSSEPRKHTEPIPSKETARERLTREVSKNPRWNEASKSRQGFVIVGARRSHPK